MTKVWFITGAARGIGAEIAHAALAAGDSVVATGRDPEKLKGIFADHGDRVLAVRLDVANENEAQAAAEAALARFGRIDVLVNNAGYGLLGVFEEVEPADIATQFATNVEGLFHVTRAVLPAMRAQRSGRIFNIASIGGVLGFKGASIYCATKFAVAGFSESLDPEVAPFGIRVTTVEPGFFRTDFLDGSSVRYGDKKIADYAALSTETRETYDGHSHKQAGDPKKLAKALLTLADAPEPPLHFLAGADAVAGAEGKIQAFSRDIETWRELSVSTAGDF